MDIGFLYLVLLLFSYFDIFNKREIPDFIVYLFFVSSLFFAALEGKVVEIVIALLIVGIGYILSRNGLLGWGDSFVIAMIFLFYPIFADFDIPLLTILFYSIFFSSIFLLILFAVKKKNPFSLFPIAFFPIFFYSPFLFFLLYLFSFILFVRINLKEMKSLFIEEKKGEELTIEDVLHEDFRKYGKIVDEKNITKLRKLKKVKVYTYLPFIPFLLLAVYFYNVFGNVLLLF